jgi:2-succinyl-5-enolpyruvyl-6-hydroxy-3-cyclohexene-1-carboxylate synthase
MRFQSISDIAELCAKKGVNEVVLCPGSRSAPLTLSFTRHPKIRTRIFSDERSAGFIALGMAQTLNKPVAVVCTSGTAAYNLAPAVAEAFFGQTPLLILTADRPPEWIAQHDGQTIFQNEIYGKHVKKFFQLPQEYDHPDNQWAINRIVNEAINLAEQEPRGPVHINAPFREPLYPEKDEVTEYSKNIRVMEEHPASCSLSEEQKESIRSRWSSFHHVLIAGGQHPHDDAMSTLIRSFAERHDIPIITDIISNLHSLETGVKHADLFMGQASDDVKKSLRPDLLITFGQSLISKNTKNFLRKYSPAEHWHIQPHGPVADTFKNITSVFRTSPSAFFEFASTLSVDESFEHQKQHNYCKLWEVEERRAQRVIDNFFDSQKELAELELVLEVLHALPSDCNLHLANSMSVRYANFIGLKASQKNIQVFSNRGTSGIDGCTSTSVGHCLASDKPTFLITGDVAFFYDRNAFWHNYPIENLRIVLLNNHGGLIFNMIDGPASLPEAGEYFITRQILSAKKLCEEFQFDHLPLDNRRKLKNVLKDFFDFDGKTKILELETDVAVNKTVFDHLKQKIKKSYEL